MEHESRLHCGHLGVRDAGSSPFDAVQVEALEYITNHPTNAAIATPDGLQLYTHTFAVLESARTIHIEGDMAY